MKIRFIENKNLSEFSILEETVISRYFNRKICKRLIKILYNLFIYLLNEHNTVSYKNFWIMNISIELLNHIKSSNIVVNSNHANS